MRTKQTYVVVWTWATVWHLPMLSYGQSVTDCPISMSIEFEVRLNRHGYGQFKETKILHYGKGKNQMKPR